MKVCVRCGEVKPVEDFPMSKVHRDGRYPYCLVCKREYMRDLRQKQIADGTNARNMLLRALKRWGVDIDWWEERIKRQFGRCLICKGRWRGNHGRLVVDHNHATGKARGVICGDCNTGLGMFKDDPALLRRAAEYIEREGDIEWLTT